MRRLLAFWIGLTLSTAIGLGQTDTRPPREDTQLWNDVQVTVRAGRNIDWTSSGMIRFGYGIGDLIYERVSSGLAVKFGRHLSTAAYYSYYALQPTGHIDVREHRLTLDGTFRWSLGRFILSDRNRFERRFFDLGIRLNRYRNRFQIERPLEVAHGHVRLFASDEIYYEAVVNSWTRNRFSAGVGFPIRRNLELEAYFLRQNDGYARPGDINAIGTSLKVSLF